MSRQTLMLECFELERDLGFPTLRRLEGQPWNLDAEKWYAAYRAALTGLDDHRLLDLRAALIELGNALGLWRQQPRDGQEGGGRLEEMRQELSSSPEEQPQRRHDHSR